MRFRRFFPGGDQASQAPAGEGASRSTAPSSGTTGGAVQDTPSDEASRGGTVGHRGAGASARGKRARRHAQRAPTATRTTRRGRASQTKSNPQEGAGHLPLSSGPNATGSASAPSAASPRASKPSTTAGQGRRRRAA